MNQIHGQQELRSWQPGEELKKLSADEVRFANGFLRAQIDAWFSGLQAQWTGFFQSVGLRVSYAGMQISLLPSAPQEEVYVVSFGAEHVGLSLNPQLSEKLSEYIASGIDGAGGKQLIDYLARRILRSLEISWSGPSFDESSYEGLSTAYNEKWVAQIEVNIALNDDVEQLRFYITEAMRQRFDVLWKKQLHSRTTLNLRHGTIAFELAHFFIEARMVSQYIRKGQLLDFDIDHGDRAILLFEDKPWLPGRLFQAGGAFAAQVMFGAVSTAEQAEQHVRLSLQLAEVSVNPVQAIELNQSGAVIASECELKPEVVLKVGKEELGRARVCVQEGKFLFEVV